MNQYPNQQNPKGESQSPQQPYPGQQSYPGQQPRYPVVPPFQQKPQRPGWVIPLIVVVTVSLIACAVLVGMLFGQRLTYDIGTRPEKAESSEPVYQKGEASVPAPAYQQEESRSEQPAGTSRSVGDCLDEAIDWIEDDAQFVKNYEYEPLGCVDDFDGDGYQDFLAVYQNQARNGTRYVGYCVFTFREDGPKLLCDGVLYQEVGGNGGSLGISRGKDGTAYLARFTSEPNGDGPHNFYEFIPFWDLGVTENNIYRMESQWSVDAPEQGTYLLDGRKVDQEAFNVARGNYEEWYSINIVAGHGSSEKNGVDFDTLKQWYGD